jgi:hypothetical protein
MSSKTIPAANLPPSAPVADILFTMLSRGEAPALDMLLLLSRDEPLSAAEPYEPSIPNIEGLIETSRGKYALVPTNWTSSELSLSQKHPGLQLDYCFREARKYNSPYGEPLSGWVRELLTTAKMHWSRAVEAYHNGWAKHWGLCSDCTNLQFGDWLPDYMNEGQHPAFQGGRERWGEAGQIVRIACGLPRFAQIKRRRTGR